MAISNLNHEDKKKELKEIDRMRKAMLKLQSLVHKGIWEDESSKSFAAYLCDDVVQCLETFLPSPITPNYNGLERLEVKQEKVSLKKKARLDDDAVKELIRSDLNDGYKWKKYGKKYIKASQNARTYYRCAYSGCNVTRFAEPTTNPNGTPGYKVTYHRNHTCKPTIFTRETGSPAIPMNAALASSGISPNVGQSNDMHQIRQNLLDEHGWGSSSMNPNYHMEPPTSNVNSFWNSPMYL